MIHYDFILFENCHAAKHHIFDVVLIARMLQSQGLKVAILNIYSDIEKKELDGIEVINLPFSIPIPNDKWKKNPKNKIHSLLCNIRFFYQQHFYIKKVVKYITPLADRFYCGSLNNYTSLQFFKIKKISYFWGLRSYWFNDLGHKILKDPISSIRFFMIRHFFYKNANLKLFVSNQIIKDEFEKLGINKNRIVIREERCIENRENKKNIYDYKLPDKGNISFLTIGMLRKEKNISLTISAFKIANLPSSELKLIGRTSNSTYENEISQSINNDTRIIRINKYLEYEDFFESFRLSHFVLFADKQAKSCITNGTMMEALINRRPIICPDYNPYSYYINKYNIGLLYNPKDVNSYADTLRKAYELGYEYFLPFIDKFLNNISFENISRQLVNDIYYK